MAGSSDNKVRTAGRSFVSIEVPKGCGSVTREEENGF